MVVMSSFRARRDPDRIWCRDAPFDGTDRYAARAPVFGGYGMDQHDHACRQLLRGRSGRPARFRRAGVSRRIVFREPLEVRPVFRGNDLRHRRHQRRSGLRTAPFRR